MNSGLVSKCAEADHVVVEWGADFDSRYDEIFESFELSEIVHCEA